MVEEHREAHVSEWDSDQGVQYPSMRYTDRLAGAGIVPSVDSQGDASDDALAESVIGL